ncbi:GNAT family N-acetyltransferase [Kitasatospora sp. NPDC088134]|uniref:GNAT family N-acetyltransferase n=1 Tax=Kitasatospora sp. NPDC088134 TaxID=3364071 RepID=UPI0037F7B95C
MPDTLTLQTLDAQSTRDSINDLVGVYARVYDVPPYADDPFFSNQSFRDRLLGATQMPGFLCLTATAGRELVGLVHGVTLQPTWPWWVALGEHRAPEHVAAVEAGQVSWLRELMVLPQHTNHGIGRRLHNAWRAEKALPLTALTCIIDNEPAHGAYLRWGYEIVGEPIRHAPESPLYDPMILTTPPAPSAAAR